MLAVGPLLLAAVVGVAILSGNRGASAATLSAAQVAALGAEGLVGRIALALPPVPPDRLGIGPNRFTIDDVRRPLFEPPPWIRRIAGLSSWRTDPFER